MGNAIVICCARADLHAIVRDHMSGLKTDLIGHVDNNHSTGASLLANAVFTGATAIDVKTYALIVASVLADQSGTLHIDESPDAGVTWPASASTSKVALANVRATLRIEPTLQHVRVRFANGSSAQGAMSLQTRLLTEGSAASANDIAAELPPTTMDPIALADSDFAPPYREIYIDTGGSLKVTIRKRDGTTVTATLNVFDGQTLRNGGAFTRLWLTGSDNTVVAYGLS